MREFDAQDVETSLEDILAYSDPIGHVAQLLAPDPSALKIHFISKNDQLAEQSNVVVLHGTSAPIGGDVFAVILKSRGIVRVDSAGGYCMYPSETIVARKLQFERGEDIKDRLIGEFERIAEPLESTCYVIRIE